MKHVLRSFALFIAIGSIFHQVTLAQAAESKITTTENYYKCPPAASAGVPAALNGKMKIKN
jgi:hypothetical protein